MSKNPDLHDVSDHPPVWRATLGAIIAGLIVLVTAVLPAEYGVDPTGLGRAMGLTALSDPPPRALSRQDAPYRHDAVQFTLQPYEVLEYKYILTDGAGMVFGWSAEAPLVYDFHSEPEGADEGFAESFDAGTATTADGIYIAPFDGHHGWYWENRAAEPVIVSLRASGTFTQAIVYRDGFEIPRTID